jgi:hypothetical protein
VHFPAPDAVAPVVPNAALPLTETVHAQVIGNAAQSAGHLVR